MPKVPHAKIVYLLLFVLLLVSFFVRVYRTDQLLRFYYDQGRDALVIDRIIHEFRPVLVGPTTGLAGILRGPAFYYLLLPAYALGQGSPVIAAVWLQLVNIVGLVFVFASAAVLMSPVAGLLAVILVGLSNHIVDLSRWLSNPSPILTSVPIMLYGLIRIHQNIRPHFWWPVVALMAGLNLQFEMASEFWFLPAILVFILLFKDMRPDKNTLLLSSAILLATLLPQVAFDIRHQGLMSQAVIRHFTSSSEGSFSVSPSAVLSRLDLYFKSFSNILVPGHFLPTLAVIGLLVPLLFTPLRRRLVVPLFLLVLPLLVLLFYNGNQGNFYSYYLIGLFPLFSILVACVLTYYLNHRYLFFIPAAIVLAFLVSNITLLHNFLSAGVDGPEHISLGNQIQALDWIYQDAAGRPFSVDIYVPPIIPYSYDYLFVWYGQKQYHYRPSVNSEPLLYTLYEVNPQDPARVQAWIDSHNPASEVRRYGSFGGIHVEQRILKSTTIKPHD